MFLIENELFKQAHLPNTLPGEHDLLFIYQDQKIALTRDLTLPQYQNDPFKNQAYCFGSLGHQRCLLIDNKSSKDFHFYETKTSHQYLPSPLYQAAAVGGHLHHWRQTHQYCGRCASPMVDDIKERARTCPACHLITYPRISPCVIVLIKRDNQILLARSKHFPKGMMSTLAGFIEIGESVEQALLREVKEEVGISIGNLQYICSQPWPFPDSLMLGFTADYLSGELRPDPNEIELAAWFDRSQLPEILPSKFSIARKLIEQC